jgi:DNA mismatch endonuclease (patch repair protein)
MRSKNTTPEIKIQQSLYFVGLVFDSHVSSLPGTPDIVITSSRLAIFVHGCYWHRHANCAQPRKRDNKNPIAHLLVNGAVARDAAINRDLTSQGYTVFTAWECHVNRDARTVAELIKSVHEKLVANPDAPIN